LAPARGVCRKSSWGVACLLRIIQHGCMERHEITGVSCVWVLLLPGQPGTVLASAASGPWDAAEPAPFQDSVLRRRGRCSWFVTGPVYFVVTETALDFPAEQLRFLLYLLETWRQSQGEEIGQGEMAHASMHRGKKT